MTWRYPPLTAFSSDGVEVLAYVIASRDDSVLAEVVARRYARRIEPHLLLAELTGDEVSDLRRQYAGRAVIAPDAPMSPFGS